MTTSSPCVTCDTNRETTAFAPIEREADTRVGTA
jgi:hypothetical protein